MQNPHELTDIRVQKGVRKGAEAPAESSLTAF